MMILLRGQSVSDPCFDKMSAAIYKARGICENWAKRNQVNYLELMVLRLLRQTQICTQKEIRRTCALPKQTINNAVRALSRSGYLVVSRTNKDKRQRILQLTEEGVSYADEKLALLSQIEKAVCDRMGTEEFAVLSRLIRNYVKILEIEMSNPEHFGEY